LNVRLTQHSDGFRVQRDPSLLMRLQIRLGPTRTRLTADRSSQPHRLTALVQVDRRDAHRAGCGQREFGGVGADPLGLAPDVASESLGAQEVEGPASDVVGDSVACRDHSGVGQLVTPGAREVGSHRFGDLEVPRPPCPATKTPEPWRVTTSPSCASSATAARIVMRATPKCVANATFDGSRVPGVALRITAYSHAAIWR
jgi:hypothetical protein